ncbi:hypothetical protein TNCV_1096911 [Trichonephila clavipes]|nr:hypothetical protein TNCV_1096911 [Trichonephila clavipes]
MFSTRRDSMRSACYHPGKQRELQWLQPLWLQSHVAPYLEHESSSPSSFGPHGGVGSTECRPLAYVHRALPARRSRLRNWVWTEITLLVPLPRATVFLQLRSIPLFCFLEGLLTVYTESSVDVVACGRPAPGRCLTFPRFLNRFHSLATTLLATPTASATPTLWLCSDSSLRSYNTPCHEFR